MVRDRFSLRSIVAALARAATAALAISISACAAPNDNETSRDEDESERADDDERDGDDDDERDDPELSKVDAGARPGSSRGKDASAASIGKDSGQSSVEGSTRRSDAGNVRDDGGHEDAPASAESEDDDLEDPGPDDDVVADDSPCAGGRTWLASDAAGGTPVSGNAMVQFRPALSTQIVELKTSLTVPAKPTSSSTLYVWPGLEPWPGGDNFNPAGQGVLQPVLTWGTSCGTYAPSQPTGWWISPQYVNPYTSDRAFYGCMGSKYIDVQAGDELEITMSLQGTVWSQLVVDRQTGQMTSFDMDLAGQAQNWALFEIEMPSQNRPVSDIIFSSTTLTFADPDPMACQPSGRGANDYFTAPQSSQDGTKCCIAKIVLRARGVPATTPNAP